MLGNLEKLLKQVDNRARFLSGVLSGDIQCINRKENELRQEFIQKGFDPLPKEETGASPVVGASDYDYLTSMSVSSFNEEYLQHLLELKRRLQIKVGFLRTASPQCLKSQKEPPLLHVNYKKAQSGSEFMMDTTAKDSKVSEGESRWHRKRTADESLETSAMRMDDDEEEAPELKNQSKEHTETECSPKQEQKNQRTRRKKQRKEASETTAQIHCPLDFQGDGESGHGFLVDEIKRIASGLDGIEITRRNRDQTMVAHELAKLSLLPMSCTNDD